MILSSNPGSIPKSDTLNSLETMLQSMKLLTITDLHNVPSSEWGEAPRRFPGNMYPIKKNQYHNVTEWPHKSYKYVNILLYARFTMDLNERSRETQLTQEYQKERHELHNIKLACCEFLHSAVCLSLLNPRCPSCFGPFQWPSQNWLWETALPLPLTTPHPSMHWSAPWEPASKLHLWKFVKKLELILEVILPTTDPQHKPLASVERELIWKFTGLSPNLKSMNVLLLWLGILHPPFWAQGW